MNAPASYSGLQNRDRKEAAFAMGCLSLGYSIAGAVWNDLSELLIAAGKNFIRYPR